MMEQDLEHIERKKCFPGTHPVKMSFKKKAK